MKIGIVGIGLIGASLGWDLRQLGHEVVGVSRQQQTCEIAIGKGVCDRASCELASLKDTEVIFICTPIAAILPMVVQLVPLLDPQTIITDAGSVKGAIVDRATEIWPNFVGGHPMAGNSESGIAAFEKGLFADRPYVLTPTPITVPSALDTVEALVRSLDAVIYHTTPDRHDLAVAWISHLPVMVSGSLIGACLAQADPTILDLAKKFASTGFRDTSRVGAGNPEMGMMMAQYNRDALLKALHGYRDRLDSVINSIEQNEWTEIKDLLTNNQAARPEFLDSKDIHD
ncbi:prephenate/arogenate dehydrogenase [Chamaesiphon minutus]|uniref:Prephenate dehydrogenase n=1 Tax=Chamaesiphon minutus (strain ATCC 27169 / PCC 6605) TaxID=1173020 RepID=K9UP06_CHAP6|nr:prephenate/arogenate dehydrogenase [Chamaesiphon minutus]AFY96171.1 prephenate dehydrogenase [Chamaesiphon minutus PCC 6605]